MPPDYSEAIKVAKLNPSYFQTFGEFTLRRTSETLAVDTDYRTDHYSLTVDTQALNKRLQESVMWGFE